MKAYSLEISYYTVACRNEGVYLYSSGQFHADKVTYKL